MAKAFFRFLRGELNGFYLTAVHNTLNLSTKEIKDFLFLYKRQQFDINTIFTENLYGIGRFASVFLPRKPTSESRSAIYLSNSHKVDGKEFSERGLFDVNTEVFDFKHTDENITSPDINTLATDEKRSSLVGDEPVIGYIVEGERDVLDDNGKVREEKLVYTPPVNKAYSDFHGNQFSFLSEGVTVYENVSPQLYIELFKTMQWVRYNGASLATLARIVEVLCPQGLVTLTGINVADNGKYLQIHYTYNGDVPVTDKEQRLSLFQYLIETKFKQTILVEE